MRVEPCSQWDNTLDRCKSGWPGKSGLCFGIIYEGCSSCGHGTTSAPCMNEEPPPIWIREDGKPLFWED